MEEWMQQQGRNRSYSMSYADNISFYQQQLQHKQRAQHQPPLAPPQHQSFPPGMDSFLQEGSPSSMSSCGSDDAAYSSDTVVTDYTPLHQLSQHHALEHQALPAQLQRRASLSSTPVSAVAGSLSILGGFVGEGLRAEYASRRPGGRRKSICLSPSENEQQMNHPGGADDGLTPDSEMPEQIEAMRRNSLPAGADGGQQRRNSLSCPLVHNYTPLTAVPTLGRALAEGNLGQRKSIQSFLSMLAQSSHDRSEKRRKRKGSRKGRGKRYKRNDYDESSDDDGDDSSEEGGMTGSGSGSGVPNGFVEAHGEPESGAFSGFDYSSGALAAGEGSAGSDSSSDAIPLSLGDQSTPGPYEPIAPLSGSGSDLLPPYSGGAAASDSSGAHSSTIAPAAYGGATSPTGGSGGRPRSLSSPPYYGDSQAPLTHHQQLQRQYHIAQTNKRLQELRQQHLERLQRQMEQQQRPPHQMGHHQQRHSYEFTPQHYAHPQQPYQPQQQVYPPQAHVLDLEVAHPVGSVARMASSSLPSVLPSHDQYPHHYGPPPPEALLGHAVVQSQSLSQELMEQQVRTDLDFYNEFSDFNMCEPASLESLCRTTTSGDQVPPPGGLASATEDGPVSEILDEFSLVVSSSSFPNGAWLGGAPQEAADGLVEKRDQANDVDMFNDFFSLDDTSGVGSSH